MSTFNTGLTSDISIARLGKPGGFAPLGPDSLIPDVYLSSPMAGGLPAGSLLLEGTYNASTNTPDLTQSSLQNNGSLYIVDVAGTQDIGNGSQEFSVGDSVFYSTETDKWHSLQSSVTSTEVSFNNNDTSLISTNVQEVIKELNTNINNFSIDFLDLASTTISVGNGAEADSVNSIAIGFNSSVTSTESIVIGFNSIADDRNSVVIGSRATSDSESTISIGKNSYINAGENSIAIGDNSLINGANCLAIGKNATVDEANNSTAIGNGSGVTVDNSVQIGAGTNSTTNTLQFLTNTIANSQGLYTGYIASEYSPSDVDNVDSHFQAIDIKLGELESGSPYFSTTSENGGDALSSGIDSLAVGKLASTSYNFDLAIGASATTTGTSETGSIAIGEASSSQSGGISIGKGTIASNTHSVAIGYTAVASASTSYQLGGGNNTVSNSLQFRSNRIALGDTDGLYTSFTNPSNYTPSDNDNVTSHFEAIDQAFGSVAGDPYVEINSTGTGPTVGGTNAIGIGKGAIANGTQGIAVGFGANTGSQVDGIAIGRDADALGLRTIVIGADSDSFSVDTVVIGPNNSANFGGVVCIGSGNTVTNRSAGNTIVIGKNITLPNSSGFNTVLIGTSVSASGASNGIAIGSLASISGVDTVAIGEEASATAFRGVAIGPQTDANNTRATALGYNATANADDAIQLGNGTNANASTLQFLNAQLANASGLVAGHTAVNYTAADTNVDTHIAGIDAELGNKANMAPQASTVNRETIGINKTLANSDNIYQHIITSIAGLLVNLPAGPVNGTHFIIKNASSSTQSFTTNGVSLAPGNLYEVIYDGTEWVVL